VKRIVPEKDTVRAAFGGNGHSAREGGVEVNLKVIKRSEYAG